MEESRFVSKDNMVVIYNHIKKYIDERQGILPEGEAGQVLTKTEDGIEWADSSCEELSPEDIEQVLGLRWETIFSYEGTISKADRPPAYKLQENAVQTYANNEYQIGENISSFNIDQEYNIVRLFIDDKLFGETTYYYEDTDTYEHTKMCMPINMSFYYIEGEILSDHQMVCAITINGSYINLDEGSHKVEVKLKK